MDEAAVKIDSKYEDSLVDKTNEPTTKIDALSTSRYGT